MSDVKLQIAGRSYTVACQDGQEAHITKLGQTIDTKLASLDSNVRQNEQRSLLFAALLLADELDELKNRPAPAPLANPEPSAAPALEALAERLEKLASTLEA